MNNVMDVKSLNNNYYPIDIDCSNPLCTHNKVNNKELKKLNFTKHATKMKIEETKHFVIILNFPFKRV